MTADYFVVSGHHCLTVVDRYSGWICVFHFKNEATSATLISVCGTLFTTYEVPEELDQMGIHNLQQPHFKHSIPTGVSIIGYHQLNTHNPMAEQS